MNFRLLQKSDVDKLFQFELDNRRWFEKYIEAREPGFYSKFKVEKHIKTCIAELNSQTMYPAIVEIDNKIIARINLRNINIQNRSADIGYRISENNSGKGVASFAVGEILEIAKNELYLEIIHSYVSLANIASQRILEKYRFEKIGLKKGFSVVAEEKKDCIHYQLKIT